MKKIKVVIPEHHVMLKTIHHRCNLRKTIKRYVNPVFSKILKSHGINYDTNRGLMFFNTEEEATLFKLTYL